MLEPNQRSSNRPNRNPIITHACCLIISPNTLQPPGTASRRLNQLPQPTNRPTTSDSHVCWLTEKGAIQTYVVDRSASGVTFLQAACSSMHSAAACMHAAAACSASNAFSIVGIQPQHAFSSSRQAAVACSSSRRWSKAWGLHARSGTK